MWSEQQEAALRKVEAWLSSGSQVFRLFGYAGTGKTTLARELASRAGGVVLFAAFTGKAADVLRRKGCENATTLHKLIYVPRDQSRAGLMKLCVERDADPPPTPMRMKELDRLIAAEEARLRRPNFELSPSSPVTAAKLIIVDEASMIGEQVARDLLSYGTKVLVLGDPAQLPPVAARDHFTREEPDFVLTEIHRQAAGSPVLQLATLARQGRELNEGTFGDSRVVPTGVLSMDELLAHDQVLVGKNATRRALNRKMREALGRNNPMPEIGDRLVCLRNDHDAGLLNGQQFVVRWARVGTHVTMALEDEDGMVRDVVAHREHFEGKEETISPWRLRDYQCFEHALAMTVHKAQGSQWGSVAVINEGRCFQDSRRWLYTAITRAADRVTVIQK